MLLDSDNCGELLFDARRRGILEKGELVWEVLLLFPRPLGLPGLEEVGLELASSALSVRLTDAGLFTLWYI